ncbi:MAG: hypothetical protein WAW39_25635 [Prosthecobacter sp.]|uniref:hypothetical protein n=1 Tax=Prosthecobacter sp. TaxID=1965333 RepID=UPI003BAFC3A8
MNGISNHAQEAIRELTDTNHLGGIIRGCIWDPKLGPPDQHPNCRFFGEVEKYLTFRQIAHAGDTFNTYCQNILAEILTADSVQWHRVSQNLQPKGDAQKAIARLRIQRQSDVNVRVALRDILCVPWCNEVEIICELRNKIVHQRGLDPEGKVEETAKAFPPGQYLIKPTDLDPTIYPVRITPAGELMIDAHAAHWASRYVAHHIHLMDQNICQRFGVAVVRAPMQSLSFRMRDGAHPQILPPGIPLPTLGKMPAPVPVPPLPVLSRSHIVPSLKEQDCAKAWRQLRSELDAFVRVTCENGGIQIQELECNLAGRPSENTIANHEIHLAYDLSSKAEPSTRANRLGIRFRQNNFEPFVTVWSTKTRMKDFHHVDQPASLKEEIITAIHATLS